MPLTFATTSALAAGYFTFLISARSLLCSFSLSWSSLDSAGAGAAAVVSSALLALAVLATAVFAPKAVGIASAAASANVHPRIILRIGSLLILGPFQRCS